MSLTGMDDEQLAIAEKVGIAAIKYGLNPDFVLPMVQAESGFRHIKNPNSNAFGVMQLMPGTAKGLKVNPNDVDQNIEGGMRLLKELAANKNIGNDPYKILAGYTAGPATKFLTSGDMADLPSETLVHMHKVSQFHGKDLPPVLSGAPEETAPTPVATPVAPVVAQSDKVKDIPKGEVGPTGAISFQKSPKELALLGGAIGAGTGASLTGAYATYRGVKGAKDAFANLAQTVAQNARTAETSPSPGALTDRQIQGTQGENTGRARSSGFNETSAQRAARQRELYAYGEKLGLNPNRVFSDFADVGSTSSGVLAPRAAINEAEQLAAAQANSMPNRIRAGLTQAFPYVKTVGKVLGSTLGGVGAAVQGYDTARDMQQNGLTMRNAAKALATAGSAAAMVPSGLTQAGGALAQLPAAGYELHDYVANRLLTDPVTNYETVPTMRPRQRATRAGFPGVYSGVQ